jgi:hypothetical protein
MSRGSAGPDVLAIDAGPQCLHVTACDASEVVVDVSEALRGLGVIRIVVRAVAWSGT